MEVEVAAKAGACYGVNRALDLALDAAEGARPVHTLGPLIHNPRVVAELASRGVAQAESLDELDGGTVVIRTHGTSPQVVDEAQQRGFAVVDATCPFVTKVQRTARELAEAGLGVVIVGDAGHAEVEGIRAWAGTAVVAVVTAPDELPDKLPSRVGVVVQTTQSEKRYEAVVAALRTRCGQVEAHKTICNATQQRQEAAAALAARVDVMVVIGGRNSGNTRRLVELCTPCCPTYHIEGADELDTAWFAGASRVGVTAGASTPQAHVDAVRVALEAMQP